MHGYSWSYRIRENETKYDGEILFPKSTYLDKNFTSINCQTNKIFANSHNRETTEHLASTKTYFNEMIMIDTKGPINPPSDGNQYIFIILDAFSHFVTIMCAPKKAHYAYTALFEHSFMKFGLPEELLPDNGSEYINTELTHLCKYFEIKIKPSTTYAPWTNGLVEGTNRITVLLDSSCKHL